MKHIKTLIMIGFSIGTALLGACATTTAPLVIPRENNQFETIGMGKTRVAALEKATQNAYSACSRLRKSPIVTQDQTRYNGVISEQTGRVIEQVGQAVGAITGLNTPNIARDDDYEVSIKFYCQ